MLNNHKCIIYFSIWLIKPEDKKKITEIYNLKILERYFIIKIKNLNVQTYIKNHLIILVNQYPNLMDNQN